MLHLLSPSTQLCAMLCLWCVLVTPVRTGMLLVWGNAASRSMVSSGLHLRAPCAVGSMALSCSHPSQGGPLQHHSALMATYGVYSAAMELAACG